MKLNKKTIYNILFFAFIIFLFTPYGLGVKSKLIQGITYVKTFVFSPSVANVDERVELDTYDFKLKGIANANDLTLESLKGKVIFINYWATWCPPCRAEMPMIQKLYDDYKDKVVFLFITSDDKSKVENFYIDHSYEFPTYNMLSSPPQQIDTKSIPATSSCKRHSRKTIYPNARKRTKANCRFIWSRTRIPRLLILRLISAR